MNKNFPQPNLVLLLDVKPETAIKRKHGDKEFYENLDFLNDIRKNF